MFDIKNLFGTKNEPDKTPISPIIDNEAKRVGETYVNYGKRICGLVNASISALDPFLQRIYSQEKLSQVNDEAVNDKEKNKIQERINDLESQIAQCNNDMDLKLSKISNANGEIKKLEQNLAEQRQRGNELNKNANMKMIIGLIILVPLTIYLFTFYSSTFYSAFFKNFQAAAEDTGLKAAMFDPLALFNAYTDGITALVFVICAPIIFLGLGFCLHFFSIQTSKIKYLKMAAIVLVTFIFDCILAYLIAKSIYDVEALNSLDDMPKYTIAMAFYDINTWAVIFCGFIVYIIWGLVFDMTYNGYEMRKSNSQEISLYNRQINNEKSNLDRLQDDINLIKNKITQLERERLKNINDMKNKVFFNPDLIKSALADFFSGWVSVMPALGKTTEEQENAKNKYKDTVELLFK